MGSNVAAYLDSCTNAVQPELSGPVESTLTLLYPSAAEAGLAACRIGVSDEEIFRHDPYGVI